MRNRVLGLIVLGVLMGYPIPNELAGDIVDLIQDLETP